MPTAAATSRILVLMFHSIADGAGPTCIPPGIFEQQLDALARSGYQVGSLMELDTWLTSEVEPAKRRAVITFDDAFADFATEAAPRLAALGYRGAVFVPTGHVGAISRWDGESARALLSWDQIRSLASDGFEFGSHAVSHANLTSLSSEALTSELVQSRRTLEAELGRTAPFFAAPFGRINKRVRAAIAAYYDMALGVRLGIANRDSDRYDVPRIEMHYFRDITLWQDFLEGRADAYFLARRVARSLRAMRWGA